MRTYQKLEKKFISDSKIIAGVDEAGRGPLAGPVVAAAVIFPKEINLNGINDSKKINQTEREKLFDLIIENCLCYSISVETNKTIDKINILNASLQAMKKAVLSLKLNPDIILVDGNKAIPDLKNSIPVIKGDSKCFTIAAASILAKVFRDKIMENYAKKYKLYSFDKNKGYPTKEHINAILKFGESRIHRKTFLKKIYERRIIQERIEF